MQPTPVDEESDKPIIRNNECNAGLLLAMHIMNNIAEYGDVSDSVTDFAVMVAAKIQEIADVPIGRDLTALHAAIETGLLPTFHNGSSPEEAGAALFRLIAAFPAL